MYFMAWQSMPCCVGGHRDKAAAYDNPEHLPGWSADLHSDASLVHGFKDGPWYSQWGGAERGVYPWSMK